MLRQFYVVGQPGLEEEMQQEILEVWPYLLETDARPNSTPPIFLQQETGGWLIEAPLILGLQLNYFLRVASRVLLRLDEFKVRDFSKLNDRLRKIPLESYFSKQDFRVEVAASKSRLNNEKRILEVATKAWPKIQDDATAALMIRMYDDICTISVDTTGVHLHRRDPMDSDKWIGEAPIRETLAAFCLRCLGSDPEATLWDPMAGSGTFLKEAALQRQGNFQRSYSFQKFAMTPKLLKLAALEKNYPEFSAPFQSYWASDNDEKMLSVLKKNLSELPQKKLFRQDIFTMSTPGELPRKLWLVTNPPYGERLEFKEGFSQLGATLGKIPAERLGVILPKGRHGEFFKGLNSAREWKLLRQNFFKNGGIPVEFSVFQ